MALNKFLLNRFLNFLLLKWNMGVSLFTQPLASSLKRYSMRPGTTMTSYFHFQKGLYKHNRNNFIGNKMKLCCNSETCLRSLRRFLNSSPVKNVIHIFTLNSSCRNTFFNQFCLISRHSVFFFIFTNYYERAKIYLMKENGIWKGLQEKAGLYIGRGQGWETK